MTICETEKPAPIGHSVKGAQMNLEFTDLIVWIVVGLLAGSLAGLLVKRRRGGFGHLGNLAIGLAGALIGGYLFDILGISLGLARVSINLQDIVAALVGALILLAVLSLLRRN
jgi:uncharacterized membrane protein YeaQ/YmgE (transglycosylase-associated protein family)